ncbi:amino acid adenylation domain-containing protein (plasmid) [Shinella yambaruensis]|uniref:non-ribosomal peptide synthetase n=1 Tax=Shinella yambaruensis TaxID=415996 RepID=UPI003D79E1E4
MAEPALARSRHETAAETMALELHRLVAEELGAEPEEFGTDENLIELGLTSIALMRLQSRLSADGATLSFSTLVATPTVEAWAALAAEAQHGAGSMAARQPADPVADTGPFPLTDIQRAYWLGRDPHFELGGVAAHGYIEALTRDLDVERLEAALNATIAAHPMLRAVIDTDGMQRVLDDVPRLAIGQTDLSDLAAEERERRLSALRADMEQEMLPADRWPLYRIHATRLSSHETILHLSFDILVFDLKSLEIWLAEWRARYENQTVALPQPAASFREHALAREAEARSQEAARARRYWQDRAARLPLGPDLPLARPVEAIDAPRFAREQRVLSQAAWRRLQDKIRSRGVTPSAALLAAYARVLALWSGSSAFTLTTTLFNRPLSGPSYDGVIGDFTSLTLVEIDTLAPASFAALARATQEQLWRDLDNSAVSGVEALSMVAAARNTPGRALMPYVFTSALGTGKSYLDAFSGFGQIVRAAVQTPQTLLDHQVLEHEGNLVLNWDYVDAAYPEGLMATIADRHLSLLKTLAADDGTWNTAILSLPEEQAARRIAVNATAWHAGTDAVLLHDPFLRQAQAQPDAIAVIDEERSLTYGELDRASNRLAGQIAAAGAMPGPPIAVLLPKGWRQVVAVLGILKAGAAYMPVDPALPRKRIETLLAESGATLALIPADAADGDLPVPMIALDDPLLSEAGAEEVIPPQAAADDLAYVIFTSGSTGKPKGVAIQHGAAFNTVLDINARYGVTAADRCLMVSSLSFDLSVYDIFGMLAAGGAIVIPPAAPAPDPDCWLRLLEEAGVTLWSSVPALLQLLHDRLADRGTLAMLSRLRLVMLSGDWLPLPLCRSLLKLPRPPKLVSLGGATEASIWSIAHEVERIEPGWKSVPYGRPLANQTIHVLDESLAERPDFAIGEIFIGGVGLALGYWRDEEKTNARFIRHPRTGERLYRTGDFGRWQPDGVVEFLGRRDGQVKVNGLRVELGEIETLIAADPAVRQAAVVAVRGAGTGDSLAAFLTLGGSAAYREETLLAALRDHLPAALVPSTFIVLDRMPLTANGKRDGAALEQRAREAAAGTCAPPARPLSDIEKQVCDLWKDLLGRPIESLDTSFFLVGGNSLLATRLAGRLSQLFEQPVSVIRIFEHPTVAGQARLFAPSSAEVPHQPENGPRRVRNHRQKKNGRMDVSA